MNMSIDIFLREMKPLIHEEANREQLMPKSMRNIEQQVFETAWFSPCPHCGEAPELSSYDNGCEVECPNCGARSKCFTTGNPLVTSHLEQFGEIVDSRFAEDIEELEERNKVYDLLRLTNYAITAYWAVSFWNRRS